ncbi:MAG: FeoA family protein [Steroidobacteraceae bacterium]
MDSRPRWHRAGMEAALGAQIQSLAGLHKGARGIVSSIATTGTGASSVGDLGGSTIARRLLEVGFVPGERIEVVGEILPGGDPIAVRVGSSIFALRRHEAQAVLVQLESSEPAEAVEAV